MADLTIQSLRDTIDQKIVDSGSAVLERVIDSFVETERDRRAKILVNGVNALRELEVDLNKINRGDVVQFTADGKPVDTLFTKDRLNQINKAKDRITKLELALTKALSDKAVSDDFTKLEKAIKSLGNSPLENEDDIIIR